MRVDLKILPDGQMFVVCGEVEHRVIPDNGRWNSGIEYAIKIVERRLARITHGDFK